MYMFDLQSALQAADCTADPDQTCTFQCLIPTGDLSKIPKIMVLNRQVGMGLNRCFENTIDAQPLGLKTRIHHCDL